MQTPRLRSVTPQDFHTAKTRKASEAWAATVAKHGEKGLEAAAAKTALIEAPGDPATLGKRAQAAQFEALRYLAESTAIAAVRAGVHALIELDHAAAVEAAAADVDRIRKEVTDKAILGGLDPRLVRLENYGPLVAAAQRLDELKGQAPTPADFSDARGYSHAAGKHLAAVLASMLPEIPAELLPAPQKTTGTAVPLFSERSEVVK